jgi:23S rRNA pseudouridine2605 synthase
VRLAKYLAHGGVASRRRAEEIIAKGVVTVAGEVVTDPARDVDDSSDVRVNGAPVGAEALEVWAVNKPVGVVSTAREPGERRAVVELVEGHSQARLYPVGRLDADSTGLLLLTNDGALANRLTHPRYEVPKIYRARLTRPPAERELARLREGVELEDGPTAPAEVRRVADREIEIVLREGRNRQVRRMVEAVGNRVVALQRVAFGPLRLGRLGEGQARRLSDAEIEELRAAAEATGGTAAPDEDGRTTPPILEGVGVGRPSCRALGPSVARCHPVRLRHCVPPVPGGRGRGPRALPFRLPAR